MSSCVIRIQAVAKYRIKRDNLRWQMISELKELVLVAILLMFFDDWLNKLIDSDYFEEVDQWTNL